MLDLNARIAVALLLVAAISQEALAAQALAPAQDQAAIAAQAAPPAAAATAQESVILSTSELDKLLGPIALYPDPLIAQILPASTYPMDIVKAARFVAKEKDASKIDAQDWDPSVIAVAHYPSVIQMMSDDLDWTQQLGAAFLDQQADVMKAVQRLRAQAQAVGSLKTTEQQKVIVEQSVIRIEPVDPTIIYVPVYSTQVVYVAQPVYNPAPLLTFTAGVVVGVWWINTSCNWHGGYVYWGGGYHHGHGGNYYGGNNNINIDNSNNINIGNGNGNGNNSINRPTTLPANSTAGEGGKWTRDSTRGSAPTSTRNPSTGAVSATSRPSTAAPGSARPSTRPATGAVSGSGALAGRPTSGAANSAAAGSAAVQPAQAGAATRGAANQGSAFQQSTGGASTRADSSRGSQSRPGTAAAGTSRPASTPSAPSANRANSAFSNSGQSGAAARGASQRGSASRGSAAAGGVRR